MTLQVRNAAEADIPLLAAIEREFSDNRWTEPQLRGELSLSHAFLLCCEADGALAGFCDLHIVADDAHINEICVALRYRRLGCARALLRRCVELCRSKGCVALTLEVRSKNTPALRLYEKCGFAPCGARRRFYRDPDDDALCMRLELSGAF